MATLYVENVPEDLYDALRERARNHRKSIAAEVLELLGENVPTRAELARRRAVLERALKLRSRKSPARGPFPGTEEMLREDRAR
jgi:plasmid stability protein